MVVPFHTQVTVSPSVDLGHVAVARIVREHEAVLADLHGPVRGGTLRGLVLGAPDEDGIGGVVVDDGGVGEDLVLGAATTMTALSVTWPPWPAAPKMPLTWAPECPGTMRDTGVPTCGAAVEDRERHRDRVVLAVVGAHVGAEAGGPPLRIEVRTGHGRGPVVGSPG